MKAPATMRLGIACIVSAAVAAAIVAAACRDDAAPPPAAEASDAGSDGIAAVVDTATEVAADARADAPSASALFNDDGIWSLMADPGICSLREAKVVPDPFPKRIWASCGDGCAVSHASPELDERTTMSGSSGGAVGGEIYLFAWIYAISGRFGLLTRLSDGQTLAAVLDRGKYAGAASCYVPLRGGSSPFLFVVQGGDQMRFGVAKPSPGAPIAWHPHWVSQFGGTERFNYDLGYGIGSSGEAVLLVAPDAPEPEILPAPSLSIHGLGSQLVWTGWSGTVVRSRVGDGGVVDLVASAPRRPWGVRLTDDKMIWVTSDTTLPNTVGFSNFRWHWSPRTNDPAALVVHDGPTIPIFLVQPTFMQASNDWGVIYGCDVENDPYSCVPRIWRISTGETWRLPNREGHAWMEILAISDKELVMGERLLANNAAGVTDDIVRMELSALPALVSAWTK